MANERGAQYRFSIEPQPLSSALKLVAKTANIQIIFSSQIVAGIQVPAINGNHTLEEVLQKILQQYQLEYVYNGVDIVAIKQSSTKGMPKEVKPKSKDSVREKAPFAIEEIRVAVRKRDENLQDIPLSVSSLSAADLSMQQISRMDRVGQFVPNLQFTPLAPSSGHNASSMVFIRGIGQTDFIPATDPGVGLYVDGIYYARSVGSTFDIIDIERIDVLRGPQGTVFGKNAIGGAILVYSERPGNDFGGRLNLGVSNDNGRRVLASLNIPFSDQFQSRFVVAAKKRDGYVTRLSDGEDLGNDNSLSGRASFKWNLTQNLFLELLTDYSREKENGAPQVFNAINNQALLPILASLNAGCPGATLLSGVPENNDPRCANNQYRLLGPYKVDSNGPLTSEFKASGGSLNLNWISKEVQFSSVTGYRKTDWLSARDADNTPLTILHTLNNETQEQFSQEFQVSNHFKGKPLQWLFGVYYFNERAFEDYPVILPEPQVGTNNTQVSIESESEALFGEVSYAFSDQFNVTAGLRVTQERKKAKPHNGADLMGPGYNVPNPLSSNPSCVAGSHLDDCVRLKPGELLFDSVLNEKLIKKSSPMVNLSYHWSDKFMGYLSYSQGFKSGGFSTRIIAPVISKRAPTGREFLPDYDPEFVTTYEVGFKSTALKDHLVINLAAFYSEYDDIQIVSREGIAPVLLNAGTANIRGLELEWKYTPGNRLLVHGGLGLLKGEYQEFTSELMTKGEHPHALGVLDIDDTLANSPTVNASLSAAFEIISEFGNFTPHADFIYQSRVFFDAPNTPQISQSGYSVVNAGVMFESIDLAWQVHLSFNNLTNKIYRIAGNSSLHASSGYAESAYARPREWSLSVEYRF